MAKVKRNHFVAPTLTTMTTTTAPFKADDHVRPPVQRRRCEIPHEHHAIGRARREGDLRRGGRCAFPDSTVRRGRWRRRQKRDRQYQRQRQQQSP
jgi:hypothetical protein